MCGICGIVPSDATQPIDGDALVAMRDAMTHRGPDDAGTLIRRGVGLAARRLAILDLHPRGRMPMVDPSGRYWIVYNGEVYNYRELRTDLQQRGHRFDSDTDTEVVLRMFTEYGRDCLDRMNGMFAFAVWDDQRRELFLARDRLGIKPLYYTQRQGVLYFASEAKAFWHAGLQYEFDPETWEELLCYRFVSGENTPWRNVYRLLPGHHLTFSDGGIRIAAWWSLKGEIERLRADRPADRDAWLQTTFDRSVKDRLISDVPLGLLLSSGLDSASIAASLRYQGQTDVTTFTMRFEGSANDEGPAARALSDVCELDHRETWLPPGDLLAELRRASRFADEPLAHGNDVQLLSVAGFASQEATVLLSGEGSDEIFGGYVRHRPLAIPLPTGRIGTSLGRTLRQTMPDSRWDRLGRYLEVADIRSRILLNACEVYPHELRRLGMLSSGQFTYRRTILDEATAIYPGEPWRQMLYLDQHTYLSSLLDRNDRMTMAASMECRVPFLDHQLIGGVAAMPTSWLQPRRGGKQPLRRMLSRRVPGHLLANRKVGFSAPYAQYFREQPELQDLLHDLPGLSPISDGPFEKKKVRQAIADFQAGDNSLSYLVRQFTLIALWYEALPKNSHPIGQTVEPTAGQFQLL